MLISTINYCLLRDLGDRLQGKVLIDGYEVVMSKQSALVLKNIYDIIGEYAEVKERFGNNILSLYCVWRSSFNLNLRRSP